MKKNKASTLFSAFVLGCMSVQGAPIPGLYNTGVDDNGAPLGNAAVDPHYKLIESPDGDYPGPNTYTLIAGWPVAPAGPWVADSSVSRWIAPRARQSIGNAPGTYTFRTTFNLTGFDPAKAKITGRWTSDNNGVDMVLNGVSLGLGQGGNFGIFYDFAIDYGFVDGVNTLDFVVSNAGDAVNPIGLRVEMVGTVEIAGEPPRVVVAPVGGTYIVGDSVTLSVIADGTPPLSYQWKLNGVDVAGATDPTLQIDAVTVSQDGDYTVVVKNGAGEATSPAAKVNVLEPIPGLYNTGVDNDGLVLWDGYEDPHYKLTVNPDDPSVTAPIVQDSGSFPIVSGPWVANSLTSVWIGPRFETSAAAQGDYIYELEIDLTGFNPATSFVTGYWATDNTGAILINDAPTGVLNSGNFDTLSAFRLENCFFAGKNKIQFKVNNATPGYTGLRVQGIRGGAKRGIVGDQPRLISQPTGGLFLTGENIELAVVADGAKPLNYQWRKNSTALSGKTEPNLALTNLTRADAGDYDVVVSNFAGSITSVVATITILERVPNVFSTGVDNTGAVLADGEVDPHYKIIVNPTDPTSQDAIVHDSTVFPIVDGTWVRNSEKSKWIAPLFNSGEASGGDYAYRTTFDLAGFDPATAVLMGSWATDNLGTDIILNGVSKGIQNGNQFATLTPFQITSGFVAGLNTIDFHLNNADAVTGYTGLRVENLRIGALPVAVQNPSLQIQRSGNAVIVSWPASATGFKLVTSSVIGTGAAWIDTGITPTQNGDRLTVTITPSEAARFYQLKK
ncbi:MAG: immunoglobulin domain-containing protein [Verrucomicrobiota bacterium]|nr:immunoglobulin domain-containing protein [Verrucomicrobiota bacterium]